MRSIDSIPHVLSAAQFEPRQMEQLFARANQLRELSSNNKDQARLALKFKDRILCSLFYQPSTRTRLSFETAALRLGMGYVSTESARQFSSAAKGESLEDTIQVINEYGHDIIVLRYDEVGGAARAAKVSQAPVINAGDGPGEHPTQALLDAYTIKLQLGRLNNLQVVMVGDLRYSRTIRSLVSVLSKYPKNHISFVSVPELQIDEDIKKLLKRSDTEYMQTDDMKKVLPGADIVYVTRLQKEYLKDSKSIKTAKFIIDEKALKLLPKSAKIMHALPRNEEISASVDNDPRAVYFRQAGNGLYIRMALIEQILQKS